MNTTLHGINLLPESATRSLARLYRTRLAALAALFLAMGIAVSALLLAPSYVRARAASAEARQFLAASERSLSLGSGGGAAGVLAVTTERARILKNFSRPPKAARVLSALSAAPHRGVALSVVSLAPAEDGSVAVSVSGTAATRDDLVAFANALSQAGVFGSVAVPLSDLAAQSDVSFMLSFSYARAAP